MEGRRTHGLHAADPTLTDSSVEQQSRADAPCTAAPPSVSAEHRFRYPPTEAWDAGGMREAGSFRETQVLGQRPRTASPYRHSVITHQHYQVLSHFGPRRRLCVRETHTEVAGWQLFCRSSQWRAAFFCSFSQLSPVESHKEKKMRPRICKWRPWWVCYRDTAALLQEHRCMWMHKNKYINTTV